MRAKPQCVRLHLGVNRALRVMSDLFILFSEQNHKALYT